MQLTEPTYLWALFGLLIPLAIHLLSRKAGRVVKVGSIRHLTDANTRKFSSIRFNEYVLFGLRALAVVLFVLLLTGLTKEGSSTVPRWVLVEGDPTVVPGLQENLDSLKEAGYEIRRLADGFPLMGEEMPQRAPQNYPYLLQQLAERRVASIIYAKNRLQAFRGRQQALPEGIRWLQLPGEDREGVLEAIRTGGDTISVLRGRTGPDRTDFSNELKDLPAGLTSLEDPAYGPEAVPVRVRQPIRVLILAPENEQRPAAILGAALKAIAGYSGREISIERSAATPDSVGQYSCVVNLMPDLTLADMEAATTLIRWQKHETGQLLLQTGPRTWEIGRQLNRQSALKENLVIELGGIVLQDEDLAQKISSWDQRTIDDNIFFDGVAANTATAGIQRQPLDRWLTISLVLLFVFERILAFYRKA